MAKNRFNKAWLDQHLNDPYVKLARKHGYRARAAFKLIEIDQQDRLLAPGMTVVDLGSAPGAWCQVVRERLARADGSGLDGRILALDMLPMEPVADVVFLQGDFREDETLARLVAAVGGRQVNLVLSDMAPNLSGVASADSARMSDLAESALDFAIHHLRPDGALLVKCFHGSGYSQLVERFKRQFVKVSARKPKASREKSAETYLLARGVKSPAARRPIVD
jgi:23S rRNA (uridine2552-2'-O)-methyltransferase